MRHQLSRRAFRGLAAAALTLILGGVPAASAFASGCTRTAHPGNSLQQLTASPDCTLQVPDRPLTARGLAAPYVLHSAGMTCSEADQGTAAFVQAVIFDPATGALSTYEPAVTDAGQPLRGAQPAVPVVPRGAIVTVWTGFNANVLKLTGPGARFFVNFAQQSYAGSPQFFAAVDAAIRQGRVTVPGLGTARDGQACPSVRDFSVVDQDQSDNVPVAYPAYGVSNGSDDDLLVLIDSALGCTPWKVTDLNGLGNGGTAGPLEEIQAAAGQQAPAALVPGLDPFVTLNGQPDQFLHNLYRAQVGQPPAGGSNDTAAYCQDLRSAGEPRLKADATAESGFPAPSFAPIGANLALVLAARFAATWQNLTCQALTGQVSPITVTTDANGIAIAAAYA
jgi:hypothetical protein